MKTAKLLVSRLTALLAVTFGLLSPTTAKAALEQVFDVFQVGATTYHNVTVTTRNTNYVFILHSKGMTNIKVADLSPDLRAKLGYQDAEANKAKVPTVWAKQTLSKIENSQVKKLREEFAGFSLPTQVTDRLHIPPMSQKTLLAFIALLTVAYLFLCYCWMSICQKCGYDPGLLIWVPVLQLFPLLKAASMPAWWFVVFLIPGLNLLAHVVWCIKITQARNKTFLVALLLILPITNLFAVLYLAFSGGRRARKERLSGGRVQIMSLEAV